MEGRCPRTKGIVIIKIETCAYAHGEEDLRTVTIDEKAKLNLLPSAKKWRTELCFNFTTTGQCRYGKKCAFIHDEVAFLKCKNIPVKDALQFIIEQRESQEQYEFNARKIKIKVVNHGFNNMNINTSASPNYNRYAYTPILYNDYRNFTPKSSFVPYTKTNYYVYPKSAERRTGYIGTPYPFETGILNYSYDSPETEKRSYRYFSRQNKVKEELEPLQENQEEKVKEMINNKQQESIVQEKQAESTNDNIRTVEYSTTL